MTEGGQSTLWKRQLGPRRRPHQLASTLTPRESLTGPMARLVPVLQVPNWSGSRPTRPAFRLWIHARCIVVVEGCDKPGFPGEAHGRTGCIHHADGLLISAHLNPPDPFAGRVQPEVGYRGIRTATMLAGRSMDEHDQHHLLPSNIRHQTSGSALLGDEATRWSWSS